jgi:3-deoxy-D-manno-octulosonate 8-phosphate phosphatase (KDO 8-P phosphatase)
MAFFKEELNQVKAFIFDFDGVLSRTSQSIAPSGDPIRTSNIKDGFAIVNALKQGYIVGVITGCYTQEVRKRCEKLGIKHIYMEAGNKMECYEDFLAKAGVENESVMYMGDDVPDYSVMSRVGVPVCPNDAVTEIKSISKYISDRDGGEGCVRDVIEQVMRAQETWFKVGELSWSSY